MKGVRKKPAAKVRSWRVSIIRSKGEYLGSVEAPDRERAEAVAIKQFALDDDQRSRLLIQGAAVGLNDRGGWAEAVWREPTFELWPDPAGHDSRLPRASEGCRNFEGLRLLQSNPRLLGAFLETARYFQTN
jgi:hypothetical protein